MFDAERNPTVWKRAGGGDLGVTFFGVGKPYYVTCFGDLMSASNSNRPRRILPLIVGAQFACTSLWFAGNAVLGDVQRAWGLGDEALGWVTSSVQVGFIVGTLLSAFLVLSDRVPAHRLFLFCALAGAGFNLLPVWVEGLFFLLLSRVLVGLCLAGIYPVGMKLAASWFQEGLGRALGFLVGALVLGTALPHFVRSLGSQAPWEATLVSVSLLAALGGAAVFFGVDPGPHQRQGSGFAGFGAIKAIVASSGFRSAALGYFGHMWELYTVWAFMPAFLVAYAQHHEVELDVSLWSGLIIGMGAAGCVGGGLLARRLGSARVAAACLSVSAAFCVAMPLIFECGPGLFLVALALWGAAMAGDSPQLSTLNAQEAPADLVGTGLTLATSVGFALTVLSIEVTSVLHHAGVPVAWLFVPLAAGPLLGLRGLWALLPRR